MAVTVFPYPAQTVLGAWPFHTASLSTGAFTLNQTTDSLSFIFPVEETVAITRVGIRQHIRGGTAPTFRVSLMGVTSSGDEDGVIKAGGNCYVDYTPIPANDGKFLWLDLNASYTATRGEYLALDIRHVSGTIDAANWASFGTSMLSNVSVGGHYHIRNDNGSRSRSSLVPIYGYGSSTAIYGFPISSGISPQDISSPQERACRFRVPSSWGSTFSIEGAQVSTILAASVVAEVRLYDSSDNLLATAPLPASTTASNTAALVYRVLFSSPVTGLATDSWYRLSVRPISGSLPVYGLGFNGTEEADLWSPTSRVHASERSGSGPWTDYDNRRVAIHPLIGQIDFHNPSSSGGYTGRIIGGYR